MSSGTGMGQVLGESGKCQVKIQ